MTLGASASAGSMSDAVELGDRKVRVVLAIVFVGLAGLFLLTAPLVHTEANDAYLFAYDVEFESWGDAVNPRHVLFGPVNKALFAGARALGMADRAVGVISVTNALVAAAAVILQVQFLRCRLKTPLRFSYFGGALLTVTYGFWRFSAEIETYMWGLLTALALAYVVSSPDERAQTSIGAGVLAAVAFLAHGLNGLLAFVAIPVYLLVKRQPRRLAIYGITASATLTIGTALAYLVAAPANTGYVEFYASEGALALSPGRLAQGIVGLGQAMVSSQFLFAYEMFAEQIERAFPSNSVADQVYLGERLGTLTVGAMSVTFLVSVSMLLVAGWHSTRGLRSRIKEPVVILLAAWLVVHAAFVLVAGSGSAGPQLWVLVLPPMTMLAVTGLVSLPGDRAARTLVLPIVIVALLVHNTLGMSLWLRPENDRQRARSAWLIENTTDEDAVFMAETVPLYRYVRYHASAQTFNLLGARDPWTVYAEATEAAGAVYTTGDTFDVPAYIRQVRPDLYPQLVDFGESIRADFALLVDDDFSDVYVRRR